MPRRAAPPSLLAAATAALVLAACGTTSPPAPATSSATSAAGPAAGSPAARPSSAAASGTPSAPTSSDVDGAVPQPVDLDVQAVATKYLAAREDAVSYKHPNPRSWLTDVRPLMTPSGWRRLAQTLGGGGGGYPAATARKHRWAVQVTVACTTNPDAGSPSPTAATITCALTDRTVDAAGVPVPTKTLPALWPYDGPQPPALLLVRHLRGRWLVDQDLTGQAG